MLIKRYDIGVMPKAQRMDDGSIRATAVVTQTGVFSYLNKDGSVRRELRLPEEVFNKDSMDSLKMIPITNAHPATESGFVSPENAKDFQIGFTGESVTHDDRHLFASLNINTDEGIKAVDSGRRQFSLGYSLELEDKTGTYMGERYDCIQRNIKYNHLALVDRARAGAVASLRLDSGDAVLSNSQKPLEEETRMVKVNLDGLEYDCAPEVKKALEKSAAQVQVLEQKVQENKKNLDAAIAERDGVLEELKKLKNVDTSAEIQEAVNSKLKLINCAAQHLDSEGDISGLSDREIKEKVIKKVSDVNLDEKSDEYVDARFDMALEVLKDEKYKKASDENRKAFDSKDGDGEKRVDAAEAEKNYIERLRSARAESFK